MKELASWFRLKLIPKVRRPFSLLLAIFTTNYMFSIATTWASMFEGMDGIYENIKIVKIHVFLAKHLSFLPSYLSQWILNTLIILFFYRMPHRRRLILGYVFFVFLFMIVNGVTTPLPGILVGALKTGSDGWYCPP